MTKIYDLGEGCGVGLERSIGVGRGWIFRSFLLLLAPLNPLFEYFSLVL